MIVMITFLSLGILVAFAALIWFGNRQVGVVLRKIDIQERPESDGNEALWRSLEGLEKRTLDQFKDLTAAVAEGIEHVDRAERRVRAAIQSAKRRFEAEGYIDPGLEAEAAALPQGDGDPGPEEELPSVHEGVEPGSWASVPGMNDLVS